jgi:hypothetical protein
MSFEPREGQTNLFDNPGKHAEWCSEGCTVVHRKLQGTMLVNGEKTYANIFMDMSPEPNGEMKVKAKLYLKKADGSAAPQKDWAPKQLRAEHEGQEGLPY